LYTVPEDSDLDEWLTSGREQQTRGGPLPFGTFGFPPGQPDGNFHSQPAHMQPASLQE
jgi:hypothetical protein